MAISNIKNDGSYFKVYDKSGSNISTKDSFNSILSGYSEKIIVLEDNGYYKSYDEFFIELGVKSKHSTENLDSVIDSEITISDSNMTRTYDAKFNELRFR